MVLANGVRFIWLDTYIGEEGQYDEFKRMFRSALEPTAVMPPDAIDSLILALHENAAPFLFAADHAEAVRLIQLHHDKKIIFISSGTLGKEIIPFIVQNYPQVHSFFFFCAVIENHLEFALDYTSCLQIFTHQIDLLVRLARDISADIIKQGNEYMKLKDPKDALKCFEQARRLNITANTADTLNSPYLDDLRMLDGYNGNIGLIQQAKDMFLGQEHQAQPPEENEENEQLSQQESQDS